MNFVPHAILMRSSGVESRTVDAGAAVLVNLRSGAVFELNRVGAEIWELLGPGTTESAICDALAARYPIDRSALESDVKRLVGALSGAGLIETVRAPGDGQT